MRKDVCDLCSKELVSHPKNTEEGIAALFSEFSIFRVKAVYKITKFSLHLPFGATHKDMDICSNCMQDFKEFVQRKQAYKTGDRG